MYPEAHFNIVFIRDKISMIDFFNSIPCNDIV